MAPDKAGGGVKVFVISAFRFVVKLGWARVVGVREKPSRTAGQQGAPVDLEGKKFNAGASFSPLTSVYTHLSGEEVHFRFRWIAFNKVRFI
jgi:hypothetical protein